MQIHDVETLLRQAVTRLTLLAEEPFPTVAQQLTHLREVVKREGDADEIAAALEPLDQALRSMEAVASQAGIDPLSAARQALTSLTKELHLVGERQAHAAEIVSRIAAVSRELDLQLLLDDLAKLLNESLADRVEGAAPLINEVLCDLLRQINLPPRQRQIADDLIDELQPELPSKEVPRYLAKIADIMASLSADLARERREQEYFLSQLTSNLGELESAVQLLEGGRQATYSDSVALDSVVHDEMDQIRSSVEGAGSIDELKQVVKGRLDTIRQRMDSHRQQETERNDVLESKVQQLSAKIQTMEQESEALKERIVEEHRKALTDPLTEVPNRMAWEEQLLREYQRWQRYQQPLTVAVWDVDRFKGINDNFGHRAGDRVLKTVAQLLRENIRTTDFIARYGGEEFVMLYPETSLAEATAVADKLRETVAECGFHFQQQPVQITISCGLSLFKAGDKPVDVMERADKALYKAKSAGRNCCVSD